MRRGRLAVLLIVVSTFIASSGNGLLKYGVGAVSRAQPLNLQLILGIGLYGIAASMFILALRWGELSVIYPLYGLNFVWISFIALYFFNEPMPPVKWLGVALIILGLIFLGRESGWNESPADTKKGDAPVERHGLTAMPPTTAIPDPLLEEDV